MRVNRQRVLPTGPCRGRLIVPEAVALQTRVALLGFMGLDGRHEGIVFWLGRRVGDDTIIVSSLLPPCLHEPQRVIVTAAAVGEMSKLARSWGLGVVAQVHSHSGDDTRHSDGDDELIVMPTEGMFSLVVGRYGAGGISPNQGLGLHQFQDGRWVQVQTQHNQAMVVLPTLAWGSGR